MEVWSFIHSKLNSAVKVMLLFVLESNGSSPGRKGFSMAVAGDEEFCGTIGGGMMEHKLVEKAKRMLAANEIGISLVHQYHDKLHTKDQSGMICSGSQVIAYLPLSPANASTVITILESLKNGEKKVLHLSPAGINIKPLQENIFLGLQYKSDADWQYTEWLDQRPVLHIIGGGHVGLALSELMNFLNFYVKIYDDRPYLTTLATNHFAHEKHIVNYEKIGDYIPPNKEDYVVIATVGYRSDKVVFKKLLDKDFFYIGMLGSDVKIQTLFKEVEEEGINSQQWKHCFAPVGLPIFSKTAAEIAVSIAAQIIFEKNKYLPTGRMNNTK
jgi:xanthine dehydrogenase accessory factor